MKHIDEILVAKEKYFQGTIDDYDLKKTILKICRYYEKYQDSNLFTDTLCHKLILILVIEKFKSLLIFEKNLIVVFDSECEKFKGKMSNIIYIMRENESQYKRKCKCLVKDDPLMFNSFTNSLSVKRTNFPREITKILRKWLREHLTNPYPSKIEKKVLSIETGLNISQINNWFANARKRILPFMKKEFIDFD
ncbi:homeodomain-containing protein [Encephalitozoon hellem]|uniref:Homeodomain-containing protein n=1 Tax=Encephalitozoon hellem TaxID=27973 RepID=A0ABY8CMQ8_ENCHE|nr:homeodomain-containing protein [Encephalitozoon hellem]